MSHQKLLRRLAQMKLVGVRLTSLVCVQDDADWSTLGVKEVGCFGVHHFPHFLFFVSVSQILPR